VTRPSEASVVPIRLTVDGRSGLTLWATPWFEDGEEWQAFLGVGSRVLVFGTTAELADFLQSGQENDLSDHPEWTMLSTLPPSQLEPEDGYDFDLDGVYDLAAGDPDPFTVSDLSDIVDIVQRVAECCDDGVLLKLVEETPEFAQLLSDDVSFAGSDGEARWIELGQAVDRSWELVLDRLNGNLEWRGTEVRAESTDEDERAEGELADESGPLDEDEAVAVGPDGEQFDIWEIAGILPLQVALPDGVGFTLRTYAGPEDEPTFLGSDMNVDLFRSTRGLIAYCRADVEHDLAEMLTWPDIRDADPLPVEVGEEEVYDLTSPNPAALELAQELAEYCQLEGVAAAVEGGEPADWNAVLAEIGTCIRWHD